MLDKSLAGCTPVHNGKDAAPCQNFMDEQPTLLRPFRVQNGVRLVVGPGNVDSPGLEYKASALPTELQRRILPHLGRQVNPARRPLREGGEEKKEAKAARGNTPWSLRKPIIAHVALKIVQTCPGF